MTTPNTPGASAGAAIKSMRLVFVAALLGWVAVVVFFEFLDWLLPMPGDTFASRSYSANFATLQTIAFPLVAVLIAAVVTPALEFAKLTSAAALVLYAVIGFFDAVTFLIGLGHAFLSVNTLAETVGAFSHLVFNIFTFGWVLLAALAVYRIFTALGGKPR